ncbi:MAG: hypothetical protein SGPRY_010149 [Prymnesium sp.]
MSIYAKPSPPTDLSSASAFFSDFPDASCSSRRRAASRRRGRQPTPLLSALDVERQRLEEQRERQRAARCTCLSLPEPEERRARLRELRAMVSRAAAKVETVNKGYVPPSHADNLLFSMPRNESAGSHTLFPSEPKGGIRQPFSNALPHSFSARSSRPAMFARGGAEPLSPRQAVEQCGRFHLPTEYCWPAFLYLTKWQMCKQPKQALLYHTKWQTRKQPSKRALLYHTEWQTREQPSRRALLYHTEWQMRKQPSWCAFLYHTKWQMRVGVEGDKERRTATGDHSLTIAALVPPPPPPLLIPPALPLLALPCHPVMASLLGERVRRGALQTALPLLLRAARRTAPALPMVPALVVQPALLAAPALLRPLARLVAISSASGIPWLRVMQTDTVLDSALDTEWRGAGQPNDLSRRSSGMLWQASNCGDSEGPDDSYDLSHKGDEPRYEFCPASSQRSSPSGCIRAAVAAADNKYNG